MCSGKVPKAVAARLLLQRDVTGFAKEHDKCSVCSIHNMKTENLLISLFLHIIWLFDFSQDHMTLHLANLKSFGFCKT